MSLSMNRMLDNSGLSVENYDKTLIGWAAQLEALWRVNRPVPRRSMSRLERSGLEYSRIGAGRPAIRW